MAGLSVDKSTAAWLAFDDDADITGNQDIFDGPCRLHGIVVLNATNTRGYLKLRDAVSGTPGTSAYDFVFPVEPNGGSGTKATIIVLGERDSLTGQFQGVHFANGLSYFLGDAAGQALGSNLSTPPDVYLAATAE